MTKLTLITYYFWLTPPTHFKIDSNQILARLDHILYEKIINQVTVRIVAIPFRFLYRNVKIVPPVHVVGCSHSLIVDAASRGKINGLI